MNQRSRRRGENGFVLVGVIMLTLALTILGLSLFSLSGYESQFLNTSIEQSQSFYYALGGIDRAKFVLAKTERLDAVKNNLPPGVTYARAVQDTGGLDSLGKWKDGIPITLRVLSEWRRGRRMIEVNYVPNHAENFYRNLFAVSSSDTDAVIVRTESPAGNRTNGTVLTGLVKQTNTNLGWTTHVNPILSLPFLNVQRMEVARPDISDGVWWNKYDLNGNTATPAPDPTPDFVFTLDAGGLDYKVFRRPESFKFHPYWSVSVPDDEVAENPRTTIRVRGRVMWLLRRGFKSMRPVDVEPILPHDPAHPTVLIMVGRDNDPDDPDENPLAAFAFNGGLNSQSVPVILVTNNTAQIEQERYIDQHTTCNYLCVYARKVVIAGAKPPPDVQHYMTLRNDPSAYSDVLDPLYELGILPGTQTGKQISFEHVTGSWREVSPPYANAP